ncbi:MAG: hypothetical protein AAGJ35_01495 [Myxococcota bacterium]
MLLWARQQRMHPPEPEEVHWGWFVAFAVLLVGAVAFGLWVDATSAAWNNARRSVYTERQHLAQLYVSLASLVAIAGALVVRWKTHFAFMIRYAVVWLLMVWGLMIGYVCWMRWVG